MIYCDASLLVALLAREPHSDAVDRWFRTQVPGALVTSDWSVTEVGSGLALKARVGAISASVHMEARETAASLFRELRLVRVERRHFEAAGERHVMAPPKGLRAGDALHLAIVLDGRFTLATLDRRFAEAAASCGVRVEPI